MGQPNKCKCGATVPDARIKALNLKPAQPPTCINCAGKYTQRVAGFPLITGKNTYTELQLVTQDQAAMLFKAQERKGQSPGAGIRMKGH